jgi:hypothetical protein
MITNGEASMKENFCMNLVTQLWAKLSSYAILKHKLLEFIKLAKTLCAQVFNFVEDEDCFLAMAFIKTKSRGIASCHLDLCIQFYAQCFYMIENVPFEEAINQCKDMKACYYIQCWLKENGLFFKIVSFFLIITLFKWDNFLSNGWSKV